MPPKIAITIGDIFGIGPEVIVKTFIRSSLFDQCIPIVYGPLEVIRYYHNLLGSDVKIHAVESVDEAQPNVINVYTSSIITFDKNKIGKATSEGGLTAINSIEHAVNDCMKKKVDAVITAPISKEAIASAGSKHKGHTEMFADLTMTKDVLMILAANTIKVGLVTIHLPLKEIASCITKDKIIKTVSLANRALIEDFKIDKPLIALLALNPHAGEGGVLGSEELTSIIPAVNEAKSSGINVHGPFPADGFFSAHQSQIYDIIIAMYHDQGLIPFKMQAHGMGVNVTYGLPFVRTSPDHGTAYNIAGKLSADASSMREAILLALRISENRKLIS